MFYGQKKILNELSYLIQVIKKGKNYNILLSAPSGYGKTTLGLLIIKWLRYENVSSVSYPPEFKYNPNSKLVFFDEIHMLETPEVIYPLLDKNNKIYIIATNEYDKLKEPLVNRCINFIFERYTEEDIFSLINDCLAQYKLSQEQLIYLVNRTQLNPRIAKQLCKRLGYIFNNYRIPPTVEDLNSIVEGILNIRESGLTEYEIRYLDYLKKVGHCSLNNIVSMSNIPRSYILREVEPHLLYLNKIRITSKGREINETSS